MAIPPQTIMRQVDWLRRKCPPSAYSTFSLSAFFSLSTICTNSNPGPKIGIKKVCLGVGISWNIIKKEWWGCDPNAGICSEKNYFIPKLLNSHWVKRLHLSFSWEIVQFSLQHLYSQRGVKLEVSRLTIQDKNFQKRYNNHSSWCCQRSLPDYIS